RDQAQAMDAREPRAEALRIEAEALRTRGEAEAAVEPGSEALRAFEDQSLPYHLGVCARTLDKIYRDLGYLWADQAGKNFERALRTFEMLGARHALAQTQLEYGSFLILVDEVNGARELFLEALRTFEELGVDHELERVRRELEEIS
ncbi:MAG: hypothetical protein ACE5GW_07680, partial [Planctomycetota bacterium]